MTNKVDLKASKARSMFAALCVGVLIQRAVKQDLKVFRFSLHQKVSFR